MVAAHATPQRVWPGPHPDTHIRVVGSQKGVAPEHALPQRPQCAGLVLTSTQLEPQRTVPVGQLHEPPTQSCSGEHREPHAPQFSGSFEIEMHEPPQST